MSQGHSYYSPASTSSLLQEYGFREPRSSLAATAAEAALRAVGIGFPVAIKISSPDVLHKTDVGGVILGLQTAEQVTDAFERLMASVRARVPGARLEGVLVQEMVPPAAEIIIGTLDDPQFGPIVMFGLGGVFAEVLKDVSFRVAPLSQADAVAMIAEVQGSQSLRGFRGRDPVSESMLVDLLMKASRMAIDTNGRMLSADLNPILVWANQHRVVDARFLWHAVSKTTAEPAAAANPRHLERFFKARSVAVVGASATAGKIGNAVLDSLLRCGFGGEVHPINPSRQEILGAKAYRSLQAAPAGIELVVATIDLQMVPKLMRECADRGIHNLVVVSGGGKELGGEKARLESEIRLLARELDVKVVGPNCIGVFDGHSRLDTFFQVRQRMLRPRPGRLAMLTQSGTVGAAFIEHAAPMGISKFVSYGNRADVDEADLLAYLAGDSETEIIGMYIEGLEDGRKFMETAGRVARLKPVVVFKVGRTERAARAAMSHTGFFGGSYGVARGAFSQAGLIAVDSYEELVATCKALAMQPKAGGKRVAMISNGAGTMVQGIDLLNAYGLEMPQLSDETRQALSSAYPPFYIVQNPVDVTGSGTSSDYETGIEALLRDPAIDVVMPWFVFQDTPLGEDIVQKLGRLTRAYKKPILVGCLGGPYTQEMARSIELEGVPVFQSVRDWIAAARGLVLAGGRP